VRVEDAEACPRFAARIIEGIDARAKFGRGPHRPGEILLADGGRRFLPGDINGFSKRLLFRQLVALGVRGTGIFALVLLFLDANDVGRPLVAGKQILAIVGVKKFSERLNPANDHQQVVLALEREYRVHEIVPCALLAQLHLQAVCEEREQIRHRARGRLPHLIRCEFVHSRCQNPKPVH